MADKIEKINKIVEKGKLEKLTKFFGDEDPKVRAAAYEAIAADDSDASREYLRDGVKDESPEVRLAAAHSIKKIGSNILSEIVRRQLLKETDEVLKKAMQEAEDTCRSRQ